METFDLTPLEKHAILDALFDALVEIDECADISEGVTTKLKQAVTILGGHYDG